MELVVTDLKKSYDGRPVLDGLSFTAPVGLTRIAGNSGIGKTTLLRILLGLESADSGTVTGVETPAAVFQEDRLCPQLTAAANLTLTGHGLTPQDAERELRTLGFTDAELALPAARLSGGQKQRLAIARVFLKNPPILLLDEATSALDNESEILVGQSLDKLAKGRTTLTIAHRLTTIKNADRILVLGKDGIEEEGSHEELLAKKGIYYRLWNGLVSGQTL